MSTWDPNTVLKPTSIGGIGWGLFGLRFICMALVIYVLLVLVLVLRVLEKPFGRHGVSQSIVRLACKVNLLIMGISVTTTGTPMAHSGALVSNHGSWLDIFALNSVQNIYFVSKSEVEGWPMIGWIARGTGTVFIKRSGRDAKRQKTLFQARLGQGDRLLFFPEGTSTDTRRVLPFKSSLFAAFFDPELADSMWIQPATVQYHPPQNRDLRFYGWWGAMDFAPHFLQILAQLRQGSIAITLHKPLRVKDFADRKALAKHCEIQIRSALSYPPTSR